MFETRQAASTFFCMLDETLDSIGFAAGVHEVRLPALPSIPGRMPM